MAIKERSQIKGTKAQIDAFAGHEGVLGFATDTKHLHVFSGTAGSSTEFLPKEETATKTEVTSGLALKANTSDVPTKAEVDAKVSTNTLNTELAKYVTSESLLGTDGKVKSELLPSTSFLPYQAYPIGSIYMNVASVDPAQVLGGGTWVRIAEGRFLYGAYKDALSTETTGGSSTASLSLANMPSHNHGGSTGTVGAGGSHTHAFPGQTGDGGNTMCLTRYSSSGAYASSASNGMPAHTHTISAQGSGTAFSIMPPYLTVCMWKRTA